MKASLIGRWLGLEVLSIAITTAYAWTVQVMWGWFISPALGGSTPSVPSFIGLLLLYGLFTYKGPKGATKGPILEWVKDYLDQLPSVSKQLSSAFANIGFTLAFGWVIQRFFM